MSSLPIAPPTSTPPARARTRTTADSLVDFDIERERRGRVRSLAPPGSAPVGRAPQAVDAPAATVIDLADRHRTQVPRTRAHLVEPMPRPTTLPDPTPVCCAIVRATVEVLRGERPVTRLARWVTPGILGAIHRRTQLTLARAPAREEVAPVAIVRTRTVRFGDRAAEATVIVQDGDRVRAAAIRLEAIRGSWHAVALEIG